jgi:hypothetical protein
LKGKQLLIDSVAISDELQTRFGGPTQKATRITNGRAETFAAHVRATSACITALRKTLK